MAGNPDITTTYAGESAGVYISAALKQAKSLEYMTTYENIKFKRTLQVMTHTDALVKNSSCDFDAQGTLLLADKILTPKLLEVNIQLCKSDVLDDWQAAQMQAGALNSDFSADFMAFVMSYVAGHIGQGVENHIWTGADATAGSFEGFTTATSGAFAQDGAVVAVANDGGAGNAYTAANIIDNLGAGLAASPDTIYGADDLYIYISPKSYRLYIEAISALGYVNAYNMSGEYVPMFNGVNIAMCPGVPNDEIIVARQSNLFFGTDLISDQTEVRMLDMTPLDGSDNVRLIAKFSGAVHCGIGAEIVHVS